MAQSSPNWALANVACQAYQKTVRVITLQKGRAEFLDALVLVLGGCGSAIYAAGVADVGIGWLGVSFAFGLTVLTMANAVGPISGGHFNPAVTLGLTLAGRANMSDPVPDWIAYVAGAIVAGFALYMIAPGAA